MIYLFFFFSTIRAGLQPTAYPVVVDKAAVFEGHSEDCIEYWSILFWA